MATCQLADHHYNIRTLNMPSHVHCLGASYPKLSLEQSIPSDFDREKKWIEKEMVIENNLGKYDAIVHSCCLLSLL